MHGSPFPNDTGGQKLRMMWLIWGAMFGSLALYMIVCIVIEDQITRTFDADFPLELVTEIGDARRHSLERVREANTTTNPIRSVFSNVPLAQRPNSVCSGRDEGPESLLMYRRGESGL